jgi:ABC-2 type transport system permease protein
MAGQLWALTVYDLLQRVRDRSIVIFGLVVPLAIITVFNLVFGDADEVELHDVRVVAAVPAGDDLAAAVPRALAAADLGVFDVELTEAPPDEVRARVDDGAAHLGIVVPDGFGAAVRGGDAEPVRVVEGEGREVEQQIVLSVVDGVLDQLTASAVAAAAGARSGVPLDELEEVARAAVEERPAYTFDRGQTAPEQLGTAAYLVAGQAGLFLFFTVGFGVLTLMVDKETGTLARLRSMPMRRGLIVAAKALSSFVVGVVATGLLLTVGALLFDADFGSPPVVALLVVCAVAAATSLMFVIVRVARTSEQAGVAQSIVAMLLGIAGGAFFPISASGPLGTLLDLNPIAAFTRGLGISAGGGGVADVAGPVAILLWFGVVMVLASRLLPDRGAVS